MKHIDTTATAINKIKLKAKKIKSELSLSLSQALEISAMQAGYVNFHHATLCASNTKKNKSIKLIGFLTLKFYEPERTVRFELKDDDLLNIVTDELDRLIDEIDGGFGDMSYTHESGLNLIVQTCESLIKREPAFLDGYAHLIGALVELDKIKEALSVGLPVLEAAFDLLQPAFKKYQLNYYNLPNQPFFRLAHNLVLALYKANRNAEAKKLAQKMLDLWPNDNVGFRFLLVPPKPNQGFEDVI